jgi:glycerol-3-phosphate O-acyltransferase
MKAILYNFVRWLIALIARPTRAGSSTLPTDREVVYVLQNRSLTDLVILDIVTANDGLVSPHAPLAVNDFLEPKRFFSLYRARRGRITMHTLSQRMQRLVNAPAEIQEQIVFVPVTVFWGRSMSPEGSWLQLVTSEHWAVTGRIKRVINLVLARKDIWVHIGRPIDLNEVGGHDVEPSIALRRTARLLRVRLRQQRINTLGPDFSHRRTLVQQVVKSRAVRSAIAQEVAAGTKHGRVERRALRAARTIASDMSYPTIRVLSALLGWFWNKIYDGMDVIGLDQIERVGASHSLVYVPSHRSHLDYLVLSYLLFHRGFMIPHVAAGDNLNLPVLGRILRRGGAFFMRRSFRDDAVYTAVFNEYVYQVYRRGHCVEFFPEGGRTRTGRLLPARFGLMKTSLDHQERGLPKPLAFIPVYVGYEKLVEGASYLSELRGGDKKRESLLDLARNLKLIRQDFGRVQVNIGEPIRLDEWLATYTGSAEHRLPSLCHDVMAHINDAATVNPVNLVAAVTLASPRQSVEAEVLVSQVTLYQELLRRLHGPGKLTHSHMSGEEVVDYVLSLGMVSRETEPFGDVYYHDNFTSVLMTWYLNNVAHLFALPAFVASLLVRRRRAISRDRLHQTVATIFPYLAAELSGRFDARNLDQTIDVLGALGLVDIDGQKIAPPQHGSPQHQALHLLAGLVMQTLERMFIVISLLRREEQTIDSLRHQAQLIARKISRIYGINAPEFSDQRLFDQFIERLVDEGVLREDASQQLVYDPMVDQVLRAAESVISSEIRYAVLSELRPR